MTASSLFVAGLMFDRLGPQLCVLLGGWTYPLHVGSLFYYNSTGNATFVIASDAVLGVGASLVWVAQGGVVTTYVPEARRGLAIAMFLFVLNIGGSIASLWDFLSSPHSTGTVSDNAHFWFLAVMCMGWMSGIWICRPSSMVRAGHLQQEARGNRHDPALFLRRYVLRIPKECCEPLDLQNSHTFTFRGILLDRTDGRGNYHSRHPRLS